MIQVDTECPLCSEPAKIADQFRDYSTTRGTLATYDMVSCNACDQMSMVRSPQKLRPVT
ncbi:MAG: hypothetical protein K0U64_08740 [Actinomycetia bacterium]|nr:hypothetical protein [Actinomycetes bacterium]